MTVQLEGQYISHVFHASTQEVDILGTLTRTKDGVWVLNYRFRHDSGSDDPFDGSDTKREYAAEWKSGDESYVVGQVNKVLGVAARMIGQTLETVPIRSSDPEVLIGILKGKPWAHIKETHDPVPTPSR